VKPKPAAPTLPAEVKAILRNFEDAHRNGSVTLHYQGGRCVQFEQRLRHRLNEVQDDEDT
jgi:hypothetical protein